MELREGIGNSMAQRGTVSVRVMGDNLIEVVPRRGDYVGEPALAVKEVEKEHGCIEK